MSTDPKQILILGGGLVGEVALIMQSDGHA
jgi:hypothetical protein